MAIPSMAENCYNKNHNNTGNTVKDILQQDDHNISTTLDETGVLTTTMNNLCLKLATDEHRNNKKDLSVAIPVNTTQSPSCHRRQSRRRSSRKSFQKRLSWMRRSNHQNKSTATIAVQQIMSQLSPDEIELAAESSYKYSCMTERCDRDYYAKGMVRRYLEAKQGDMDRAITSLQRTLKFRQDMDIQGLRRAFDSSSSEGGNGSASHYQTHLRQMLESQSIFVQGYDKSGRATFLFVPRRVEHHDVEWTLKSSVYTMERAIACTERRQQEQQQFTSIKDDTHSTTNTTNLSTINAIIDFAGFSASKHTPPLEIGKAFLTTLRRHYAGQVHKIFILDAPASFRFLWAIFSPFIGKETKKKIEFVTGRDAKARILGEYYEAGQLPNWILPNNNEKTKTKRRRNKQTEELDLDLDLYLYKTSFDRAYEEE